MTTRWLLAAARRALRRETIRTGELRRRARRPPASTLSIACAIAALACEWDLEGAPCSAGASACVEGYVCCAERCSRSCQGGVDGGGSSPGAALVDGALGTSSSCAELGAGEPSGIYRIEGESERRLAYCDASIGAELCSDTPGRHQGVTKDPSALPFTLESVLEGGACRVWHVAAASDGRPLDALEMFDDDWTFVAVDPCLALGLPAATGFRRSAGCPYGSNPGYGSCGYDPIQDGTGLMKWSNGCLQCRVNGGNSRGYVVQGEIYASFIPWDASGQFSVVCGP
jgi:hypothetical protein